jgi:hypothetical protein
MYPSNASLLSAQSNRVFFVNSNVNVAFNAVPINRPLVSIFNPSNESIYLGGDDVSPAKFAEEVPSGKMAVIESLGSGDIYCINESGNMAVAYASEFY